MQYQWKDFNPTCHSKSKIQERYDFGPQGKNVEDSDTLLPSSVIHVEQTNEVSQNEEHKTI